MVFLFLCTRYSILQTSCTNFPPHPRAGELPQQSLRHNTTQGHDRAEGPAFAGLPEAAAPGGPLLLSPLHHTGDSAEPAGLQEAEEAVGEGGQDHREAGEAAEGGAGEEEASEASGKGSSTQWNSHLNQDPEIRGHFLWVIVKEESFCFDYGQVSLKNALISIL